MRKSLSSLLSLVLVTGCGGPPVNAGTVNGKQFIAAHTDIVMIPQFITLCTPTCRTQLTGFIPFQEYHANDWELDIRHADKGNIHFDWVSVTQSDYNAHDVGSHWTRQTGE